ncbi:MULTISPECIES: MucR family transcriptional regulator [Methylobacterium]|uniref:MucR family transcriptional regulator n=1 Tax=Methylobacterium TaxID=407 RepID=UPI001EE05C1B|nr:MULTISPECIES: MucR family transcriptional regulator [Methylobacterium]
MHAAVDRLAKGEAALPAEAEVDKPTPAQVRKSITPDALVSFVDGKSHKTLKRHLGKHGWAVREG